MIGEPVSAPPPVTFAADRPFVFAIRAGNGTLLFLGRVLNPAVS